MNEEQIRNNILFIQKEDVLTKVEGSYSGAITMKIQRNKKSYFLKIMNIYDEYEKVIKRQFETLNIYKNIQIPSLELIDYGNLPKFDKWYCIFNFIEGISLTNLHEALTMSEFYRHGYTIGSYLKKLKSYKEKTKHIPILDFKKVALNISSNFFSMLKEMEKEKREILYNIISKEKLEILNNKYIELLYLLDKEPINLIHNDIKPGNVIINSKRFPILIDIEDLQYSYDFVNFRWSIISCFYEDKKHRSNYRSFYNGVIKGLYKNEKKPDILNEQLFIILFLKFYEESVSNYNRNNFDRIKQYFYLIKNSLIEFNDFKDNPYFLDK